MKDLISRQAAIDGVKTLHDVAWKNWHEPTLSANIVLDMIRELPSVQPERKMGQWIPVDSYSAFGGDEATWMAHGNPIAFYYCSKCKEQAYAGEDGESLLTDFCPSCGARMVQEGEDNDS